MLKSVPLQIRFRSPRGVPVWNGDKGGLCGGGEGENLTECSFN